MIGYRCLTVIWFALLAATASAQAAPPPEIPSERMACEKVNNVDSCWQAGLALLESDPAKALKFMEFSCESAAKTANFAGCYKAATTYLLDKRFVNYDRAHQLFNVVCFEDPDIGMAPYACKYLGHMVQLGLGRPSDVRAAHDLFVRACFTHNDRFSDVEGCGLLAKSYLFGFDWPRRGRSPDAMALAFITYAKGCLVYSDGDVLCEEGTRFLRANRLNPELIAFLAACNQDHIATEGEQWHCDEVFTRRYELDFSFDQTPGGNFTTRYVTFWRQQFLRRAGY